MKPKILLLQARLPEDPVHDEERASFAHKAQLPVELIVPHDLLQGPPTIDQLDSYDALMVGGAGDFYVSKGDLPQFDALLEFLREFIELERPMFASCFGFQCLVKALGGEIVYDPERMEVGTYELTLAEAAAEDPIFGNLPRQFCGQMGHKDYARTLPDGAVNLVSSTLCEYHAFRIAGKPIWATQFHPELTGEENKLRFKRYLKGYAPLMGEGEQSDALSRFHDCPETHGLIPAFLSHVFGPDV